MATSIFSTVTQVVACFGVALAALFIEFLIGSQRMYHHIPSIYFSYLFFVMSSFIAACWVVLYISSKDFN
jgi:hypothetical protein